MLSSIKPNITPYLETLRWVVVSALFVCPFVKADESTTASTANIENHAEKTAIPEGRAAVNFYHDKSISADDKEKLRLPSKAVPYPVAPVERPRPLLEIGDPFLGNGPIRPGIKSPTGEMLQPWFLLYGTFRSAFQNFDNGNRNTVEWVNRLDLNGNLNFSGTERLLFSMRPLDSQSGRYTGYNSIHNNDGWQEDFNANLTKLYFEGDIGEIFPGLDPTDSHTYDIGFSIGRQRLQLQDGILANDIVDMVGITRNSLAFDGLSNLRITGLYGWNNINRGNNTLTNNNHEHSANLFGLEAEADTALNNTLSLDLLYVNDNQDKNAWYVGAASTQRFGWLNSTFRVNASIPEGKGSPTVGGGVLLLSQLSTTLPGSDNLVYFNTFWDIGRFTSAARSPDQGGPLANLGILYGPVGMGRYGVPLGKAINNTVGTAIGYQMFLDGIDSQLIFEIGGRTSTQRDKDESAIGFGARYQHTLGTHHVLRLDSFVADQESTGVNYGVRTEWMFTF
ncbi:hypothetical protein MGMO_108c00020 [Methyloglobulus morosus KoM1]|uniref:Uncharacterized protein n=1 Tax=Methyloglobulus morosus KoM1 TaxID=1116472 RepID=V5DV85_9GAMM|nr:hypothetical protein [Methyloglobulus morosus]ESS71316.1 hypothetical protein MGMO_108c00020 [Methyloglobulus morosus KoM1]